MAMRKEKLANGEYYHVYNRGVDKRDIFLDEDDFIRFFEGMVDFNSVEIIGSLHEYRFQKNALDKEYGRPDPLVHLVCYCLNPNHYHFILEQVVERGVERFMQRIGTGYAKYFNKKYQRSGAFFQGKFRAAHIDTNEYLLHVSAYVNLNDRVHQLGRQASKSSWQEFISGVSDQDRSAFCKKSVVLEQFSSAEDYRQFAERVLPSIQDRKDLAHMLF